MRSCWLPIALLAAGPLRSQHAPPTVAAGTIGGTVVDAATSLPIRGATVTLGPSGMFGALPERGSPALTTGRSATTSDSGSYKFTDLSSGRYRLYVHRIGYEPVALDVELRGSTASSVSIGLVVVPVKLHPMRVQSTGAGSYGQRVSGTAVEGDARVAAARQRQRDFLGSDVRELTHADVTEAATYGETDLFRALRRLPGVASYDDWNSDLWIRGAASNETGVTFDGLPIVHPMHARGTLSGLATDVVGAAFLHPGVRPASLGGDGAALIDVRSRPGSGDGDLRGAAGVSRVGASVELDQRSPAGRYDWAVSARRSFADRLTRRANLLTGLSNDQDAHYTEASFRGDVDLGGGRSLETSALTTDDYLQNNEIIPQDAQSLGGWGNTLARATLRVPIGRLLFSQAYGASRFRSRSTSFSLPLGGMQNPDSVPELAGDVGLHSTRSSTSFVTFQGDLRPVTEAELIPWSAGYAWTTQRAGVRGPGHVFSWGDLTETPREDARMLSYATLWGERRLEIGPRLAVEAGVRVDAGGRISNAGTIRPAPSFQARYSIDGATLVSLSVGRSYQYTQEVPTVTSIMGAFTPGVPLLATANAPAVIADQVNVGAEQWRGGGILLTANAYVRRLGGIAERTLPQDDLATPRLFRTATLRAYGAELGARRLIGRFTGMVNYSIAHAVADDGRDIHPGLGDRRHVFDATGMTRVAGIRLGAAFTAMSGAPYTRLDPGQQTRDSSGIVTWKSLPHADARNAQRMPTFASLDMLADWTFAVPGGFRFTAFAQLQNALDRLNPSFYFPGFPCDPSYPDKRMLCTGSDVLFSPVMRAGSFGVRVAF